MKAVFLDFDTLGPTDIDISPLKEQLPELEFFGETGPDKLPERLAGSEVIIVNKVKLDRDALRNLDRLKLICLAATGTDNIALQAAKEMRVAVCNIQDYCTPSVIQHVFALILALTNHLREYDDLIRDKAWSSRSQFCLLDFPIRELHRTIPGESPRPIAINDRDSPREGKDYCRRFRCPDLDAKVRNYGRRRYERGDPIEGQAGISSAESKRKRDFPSLRLYLFLFQFASSEKSVDRASSFHLPLPRNLPRKELLN